MKDCLPTDDQVFPLIYSSNTEDRFCRVKVGDIDGPDVDAALLRAGTGLDWDTAEFERAAERVLNLERAITVRHWGRTGRWTSGCCPLSSTTRTGSTPSWASGWRWTARQFAPVMDEY